MYLQHCLVVAWLVPRESAAIMVPVLWTCNHAPLYSVASYHWQELSQASFLSWQNASFVTTKVCLPQQMFVVTNLVATSILLLLRQKLYLWQLPLLACFTVAKCSKCEQFHCGQVQQVWALCFDFPGGPVFWEGAEGPAWQLRDHEDPGLPLCQHLWHGETGHCQGEARCKVSLFLLSLAYFPHHPRSCWLSCWLSFLFLFSPFPHIYASTFNRDKRNKNATMTLIAISFYFFSLCFVGCLGVFCKEKCNVEVHCN